MSRRGPDGTERARRLDEITVPENANSTIAMPRAQVPALLPPATREQLYLRVSLDETGEQPIHPHVMITEAAHWPAAIWIIHS